LRVLFVSKPVVPPWNDGSKNLVRDIAAHLQRARATVMTGPPGRFAPSPAENARVLARLLRDREHDVWHFVFAPNAASSWAARAAIALRRFRGAVVQTIASRMKGQGGRSLLFGDVVVALSEWSRARLIGMGIEASRVVVIPPCAPRPIASDERIRAVREKLGVGDAPLVLYPGDYEVSSGARAMAQSVAAIAREVPEARVVFACRMKTPRAAQARRAIEVSSKKHAEYMIHTGDVDDMQALIAATSVVAFPVDDLYGKVDVPLVLLEALALGVPIVVARGGPLEAISTARFVEPHDAAGLAKNVLELLREGPEAGRAGVRLWEERFTPERVAAAHDDLYDEALRAKSKRA
jgi:phosphatidylinositol alpha-1,6-mannosyltransferase